MTDELRSTIAEVWARHRESARHSLTLVRAAVDGHAAGDLDGAVRTEAHAEAHKLAGALGVYGYGEGSGLCLRAEHVLGGGADEDLGELRAGLVALEARLAAEAAS